jgi:hypothetical protein
LGLAEEPQAEEANVEEEEQKEEEEKKGEVEQAEEPKAEETDGEMEEEEEKGMDGEETSHEKEEEEGEPKPKRPKGVKAVAFSGIQGSYLTGTMSTNSKRNRQPEEEVVNKEGGKPPDQVEKKARTSANGKAGEVFLGIVFVIVIDLL